jgi:hypothetical protein
LLEELQGWKNTCKHGVKEWKLPLSPDALLAYIAGKTSAAFLLKELLKQNTRLL